MEFCPKCGSILIQKKKNFGCMRCSYVSKEKIKMIIKEKLDPKQGISVVKDKDLEVLPTVQEKCKKCGHNEAYFWASQTRGGDESETKFYKCKKCDYTWRVYR